MYTPLFYIIIGIIVIGFIVDQIIDRLNATWRSKPIPALLSGIYNAEQYQKQQDYSRTSDKFGLIVSIFSFIITITFLFLNGFAWLHIQIMHLTLSPLWLGLLFFGALYFAFDILTMPFDWYSTFVIEQKFGFNTSTKLRYLSDKLKSYLLIIVLGGGLYMLVFWIYSMAGTYFWLWCWVAIASFSLFMALFYSNLIVPLFNKQTPLEPGELRDAIEDFGKKAGFKLQNIYIIDGSKRSTRANAYFTGFGPKKRIVLYDTLIKDLTTPELVAVLAHEIGHYKHKHTLIGLIIGILQMGILLYILSLFLNDVRFSLALGVSEPYFHISIITFSLLYSPISSFTDVLMSIYSRKNEYQADNIAASYGYADPLISALKKLASNNLSNLTPHPLFVFLNYSHPTLLSRIQRLSNNK